MGSGLPRHIHANAHDWGQVLLVEGNIGQAFRSFTTRFGFVVASRGRLSDCEPAEAKNEGGIHRANVFAQWMLLV
jgi:hypothetical protein